MSYPLTPPYDPVPQWIEWGEHYLSWYHAPGYAEQERVMEEVLKSLDWKTVLDCGCGFGRLGNLIQRIRPEAQYTGFDVSPHQIAAAKERVPGGVFHVSPWLDFQTEHRFDLVVTSEVLMHQPHEIVDEFIEKMFGWSKKWVVSVDCWPVGDESDWCFMHNYPRLYGKRLKHMREADLQTVFVCE